MGIPVLILGESGSGKSTSLRNFKPDEVGIYNVASKPMPFRNQFTNICDGANYTQISASLRKGKLKRYVIDDSQYLLCFEFFDKASEKGYDKFTSMALNFYSLIKCVIQETPPDCIVYFLHHTESTADGRIKAKTIGKMRHYKLTIEGLFSIMLMFQTDGINHQFITQSDGNTPAKSPMEMFPLVIENDLALVDKTIREYYNLENNGGKK